MCPLIIHQLVRSLSDPHLQCALHSTQLHAQALIISLATSLLLLLPKHFFQPPAAHSEWCCCLIFILTELPSSPPPLAASSLAAAGCLWLDLKYWEPKLLYLKARAMRWSLLANYFSFACTSFHMVTTLLPSGSLKVGWPYLLGLLSSIIFWKLVFSSISISPVNLFFPWFLEK